MKQKRRFIEETTIERREAFSMKYTSMWGQKVYWGNFFKSPKKWKNKCPGVPFDLPIGIADVVDRADPTEFFPTVVLEQSVT